MPALRKLLVSLTGSHVSKAPRPVRNSLVRRFRTSTRDLSRGVLGVLPPSSPKSLCRHHLASAIGAKKRSCARICRLKRPSLRVSGQDFVIARSFDPHPLPTQTILYCDHIYTCSSSTMNQNRVVYKWLGTNTHQKYKFHIPAILQPRLTWRYLLCTAVATYVAYCFLFSMPFFAHNLPQYTGPYPVGAVDIESTLEVPRKISDAKIKETNQDAFVVETVLFTLYYPATKAASTKPRHYWISKPIAATAEGYAKLAHVNNFFTNKLVTGAMGILVGGVKIPAKVDVPLAGTSSSGQLLSRKQTRDSEATLVDSEDGGFPVIVFTHGMASSRTDYTQYCGELASRGYIVAAIEHRDGSCPGTVIMQQDHKDQRRIHFDLRHIESKPKMDMSAFKQAQLDFRQAEIEATVNVIREINDGLGHAVCESNPRHEGVYLEDWAGHLNTTDMVIAGHSYGATGALQALKGAPSHDLPFKGAIILDPGKHSGPLNSDISVPIIVIHSNSWSASRSIFYGRPHFGVVRDIVEQNNQRGNPSWFLTSLGTSHPSVTDAPLLEPLLLSWTTGARIDVHEGVRQYVHVTNDFLRFLAGAGKENLLKEKANYPEYDEKFGFGRQKGQGEGWKKYWQVHVAPEDIKRIEPMVKW